MSKKIYEISLEVGDAVNIAKQLKTEIVNLSDSQKKLKSNTKESSTAFIENEAVLKELKSDYRNVQKEIIELNAKKKESALLTKKVNFELTKEVETIRDAENQTAKLNKIKKSLNVQVKNGIIQNKEEYALAQKINKQIDINTNFIKANSSAIEKQKMNIGNYASALDGVSPRLSGWIRQGQTLIAGMKAQNVAIKGGTKSFKGLRIAIASTGIGLLLIAIVALGAAFSKAQPLIDKVNVAFAGVGAIVNVIIDRFIQVGEVLSNVFNQSFSETIGGITKSFSGMGDEMERELDLFMELERASQRLRDLEIEQTSQQAERLVAIEQLRFAAKDENKTIDERVTKLKLAQQLEQQTMKEQVANAEERLRIFAAEEKNTKSNAEDKKKLAELTAEVSNVTVASMKKQRTLEAELQSLQKRNRTQNLTESQKIHTANKAQAKKELDQAIKNVGIELETYKLKNEVKLEEDAKLNDAFVQSKLAYLSIINQKEKDALKLKYDNGLIQENEYNLAKLQLENDFNTQKLDLNNQFQEQEALDKATKLEEDRTARQTEFELQLAETELKKQTEYEQKLEIEALQYENDQILLIERLENEEITEEEYRRRNEILTGVHNNKLKDLEKEKKNFEDKIRKEKVNSEIAAAGQTLGVIADLFGETSKIGKAAALAQALINTYQGITAGVALGYPMAIPAVAMAAVTGFKAVKNITSTKTKFAKGGLTELDGKSHSQGGEQIYIGGRHVGEMEGGELFGVMSRTASEKFMDFNSEFTDGAPMSNYFENGTMIAAANTQAVSKEVEQINQQTIKVVNIARDTIDVASDEVRVENMANL